MRGWMAWGPLVVALALLLVVEWGSLDRDLFLWFNGLPARTGPELWAHITFLGDGLVCAVLLLPWIRKHPERVWGGLLGALLMVVILRLFKGLLSLPRPLGVLPEEMVNVIGPGHRRSAFPSGHAATFAVWAGVWALSTSRRWLSGLVLCAALLVGISRMAVGVHWPTDVLGGFALGWGSAWMGLRWAPRAPWGLRQPGRSILAGALVVAATVLLIIDHTGYPGVLISQRLLAGGCLAYGLLEIRRMKLDWEESGP